jgi:ketosteroid isomerase-like protein
MKLLLVPLMAGCMPVPQADLEGLKGMEGVWQSALDAKDPGAMTAIYAEDGVLLPPNSEAISGRAAIQAFWAEALVSGINGVAKDTEVYAHRDLGYTVGTYTATGASGATIDEGKYLIIWRNVDGEWKIHRDIWNSSLPLPAPD